jgi:hypothetical protein
MIIVIVHIAVLAVTTALTIVHIAGRRLHRLRRKQYQDGQKNVFHSAIIHFKQIQRYSFKF